MLKRLLLFVLVAASLAMIALTLFKSEQKVDQKRSLLTSVPTDAMLILETDDMAKLWSELSNGSVIWEAIRPIGMMSSIDSIGAKMDSTFWTAPQWQSYLSGGRALMSIHPGGGASDHRLWVVAMDRLPDAQMILDYVTQHLDTRATFSVKEYESAEIHAYDGREVYFALYGGQLLVSDKQILVERAIRTIDSGTGMDQRPEVARIHATGGSQATARILIDMAHGGSLLAGLIEVPSIHPIGRHFGGWGEYDLKISPNSLVLNGLVSSADSSHAFLGLLSAQEPVDFSLTDYLPRTTSEFTLLSLTDKKALRAEVDDYLSATDQMKRIERLRASLSAAGVSADLIWESIGDAMVVGRIEGQSSDDTPFIITPLIAESELLILASTLALEDYREVPMYRSSQGAVWEATFGSLMPRMDDYVLAVIDDHLMAAADERIIRSLIDAHLSGRSLGADEAFGLLAAELSDESAMTYYFSPARGTGLLEGMVVESLRDELDANEETLRQFQGICLQFEHSAGDLFYQSALLHHNPVYKKETSSVWELAMDTTFSDRLWAVKNHKDGRYETLIQDDRNDLHLVSTTGKVLWTRSLGREILSDVTQVDGYKNGRLQYVFNTSDKLYYVDRLGRDVEGYPITLPSPASSSVAVMDYDDNKRYRLLIGTEDGALRNYGLDGKEVKGWEYSRGDYPIIGVIRHFTISSKDYISCIDANGNLSYLERSGKIRHDASQRMEDYDGGQYMIRTRKDISSSRLSYFSAADGDFWTMSSDGDDMQRSIDLEADDRLVWDPMARLYHLRGQKVDFYTSLSSEKVTIDLMEAGDELQVMATNAGTWLFVRSAGSGDAYLYTLEGELVSGFPIRGSTTALIRDMDGDGNSDLVVGDAEGVVYMYALSL